MLRHDVMCSEKFKFKRFQLAWNWESVYCIFKKKLIAQWESKERKGGVGAYSSMILIHVNY